MRFYSKFPLFYHSTGKKLAMKMEDERLSSWRLLPTLLLPIVYS